MANRRRAVVVAAAMLVVLGCSSDDSDSESLRDADEVERDVAESGTTDGVLGEPVELDEFVVTVSTISFDSSDPGDPDYGGTIAVELRTENPTGDELGPVDFNVVCSNTDETGGWYADSTYAMTDSFPPETFREGTLILGVPLGCEDSAVRAEPTGLVVEGDSPSADWLLPEDVVAQLG